MSSSPLAEAGVGGDVKSGSDAFLSVRNRRDGWRFSGRWASAWRELPPPPALLLLAVVHDASGMESDDDDAPPPGAREPSAARLLLLTDGVRALSARSAVEGGGTRGLSSSRALGWAWAAEADEDEADDEADRRPSLAHDFFGRRRADVRAARGPEGVLAAVEADEGERGERGKAEEDEEERRANERGEEALRGERSVDDAVEGCRACCCCCAGDAARAARPLAVGVVVVVGEPVSRAFPLGREKGEAGRLDAREGGTTRSAVVERASDRADGDRLGGGAGGRTRGDADRAISLPGVMLVGSVGTGRGGTGVVLPPDPAPSLENEPAAVVRSLDAPTERSVGVPDRPVLVVRLLRTSPAPPPPGSSS